jgi:hypothetical protein
MSIKNRATREKMTEWLASDGRGIIMVGDYVTNKTKSLFMCHLGHTWETRPNDIKTGHGCPRCSGKHVPTVEEFNEFLLINDRKITLVGDYKGNGKKTLFECYNPNHPRWESTPNNIKNGNGCPCCTNKGFKPYLPGWEYGFIREGYLKIGITNDLTRRLDQHRQYGEITVVHERYHEVGQKALDWENNIKRNHEGRLATKEQCPDGYTETFDIKVLEVIKL